MCRPFGGLEIILVEFESHAVGAILQSTLAPRRLDENTPHGLGGRRKEVRSAVPLHRFFVAQ
jgi:hypothetical protein